jgi:hypothetical protein
MVETIATMNSGLEVEAFMLKCACSVSLPRKQKVAAHTIPCTDRLVTPKLRWLEKKRATLEQPARELRKGWKASYCMSTPPMNDISYPTPSRSLREPGGIAGNVTPVSPRLSLKEYLKVRCASHVLSH